VTVVYLPRRRRYCTGCGIEYLPMRPHHALCRPCFAWRRIALHIRAVRVALETAR
jgi:hypothetical protein